MNERDEGYLFDMLETADKILSRAKGLGKSAYDESEDRQIVFTHLVQIVGEVASRVSSEVKDANPEIPWANIVGTRHRLVHDYVRVDTEILWRIITVHIPKLREQLVDLVGAESDEMD